MIGFSLGLALYNQNAQQDEHTQTQKLITKKNTTMKQFFSILALAVAIFTANSASAANIENEYPYNETAYTTERVMSHSTDEYEVYFDGKQEACVIVIGDGDTDLDLYIYDENGNLIDSDTDELDTCVCTWTPKWGGYFTIKVKNLGNVYNEYTIGVAQ